MSTGLNIGRLVRVDVTLSPLAAPRRGFGTLLIITDKAGVFDEGELLRTYGSYDEVIDADFEVGDPAAIAAALYFGQSPRPARCMVGFWDSGADTAAEVIAALADASGAWYGCMFAATAMPNNADLITAAGVVQALTPTRWLGISTDDEAVTAATDGNIAKALKDLLYDTLYQWSGNAYATASAFGRMFSVNFAANRSMITLMFKVEPGIEAEDLTTTQANNLQDQNANVYVKYDNNTSIIQYGKCSSGKYADEKHGLDWLADALQNALWNLLYTTARKIPQTDEGQHQLVNACAQVCDDAINNGLIAPGTWNADGFGQLARGDFLKGGYYIYTQLMSSQDQATREQRIAPPIQMAVKLAGAVHEVDCLINVNR